MEAFGFLGEYLNDNEQLFEELYYNDDANNDQNSKMVSGEGGMVL